MQPCSVEPVLLVLASVCSSVCVHYLFQHWSRFSLNLSQQFLSVVHSGPVVPEPIMSLKCTNSSCRVFSADTHEKKLVFHEHRFIKTSKITFTQPDPTRFPSYSGEDLSHFRHKNLTPDRGIEYRNKSFKSTKSSFMRDGHQNLNLKPRLNLKPCKP